MSRQNLYYRIFMKLGETGPVFTFTLNDQSEQEMVRYVLDSGTLTHTVSDPRFRYDMTPEAAREEAIDNLTTLMGEESNTRVAAAELVDGSRECHPEYGIKLDDYLDDCATFLGGEWAIKVAV